METKSRTVQPELPMAIYDVVRILMDRGYLHSPNDVEFVRPRHKSVFPCGQGDSEGPIDLNQLKWAAENGEFFFCWYKGSFLKLGINKGTLKSEVIFDPTKRNVWEFVCEVDSTFK